MQQENYKPARQSTEQSSPERRGFLMKSAVLLSTLGVAGGINDAVAQQTPEQSARTAALQATLAAIKQTGNVEQAIREHGAGLPPEALDTLRKLTPADIEQMRSLDTKLGALRGAMADGNNGGNGM
jgi:hypothetical protein